MEKLAIHINDIDTCVTVTDQLLPGDTVTYRCSDGKTKHVIAKDKVPIFHKIAILPHQVGDYIVKYGYNIGIATKPIEIGEHVHIHNISPAGKREDAKSSEFKVSAADFSE